MNKDDFFKLINEHGFLYALDTSLSTNPSFLEIIKKRLERLSDELSKKGRMDGDLFIEKNQIAWAINSILGTGTSTADQGDYDKLQGILNEHLGVDPANEAEIIAEQDAKLAASKAELKKNLLENLSKPALDLSPIPVELCQSMEGIIQLIEKKENILALRNLHAHVLGSRFHKEWTSLLYAQQELCRADMLGILEKQTIAIKNNQINHSLKELTTALQVFIQSKSRPWYKRFL